MLSPTSALVVSAALTLFLLLFASLSRAKGWTPAGMWVAFGNRDDLPPPTAFDGRADRTAKNTLEAMVLFVAVLAAAWHAQVPDARLEAPVTLFVAARVVYAPVYWAGLKVVRTAVWGVGVAGLCWIAALAMR